jgi:activator of HSP90 ATPase
MSRPFTRRELPLCLASLYLGSDLLPRALAHGSDDVTRNDEAIHQVVTFNATAKRVYDALTDPIQFTRMTTFSTVKNAPPAIIGKAAGESFSLFAAHIVGRHLELVPSQRIVQAWRVVNWDAGVYSIARFELSERGGQTTISFEHRAFPNGEAQHLAEGWTANYWDPLKKHLG